MAELLRSGAVALFLDGLQQIPAAQQLRAGQRLAAESAGLRIVVTARPGAAADVLGGRAPEVMLVHVPGAGDKRDAESYRQFLVTAYPDEVTREHAVHWLAWIAAHLGNRSDIDWWHVPGWFSPKRRRRARSLVLAGLFGPAVALMSAGDSASALIGGVLGTFIGAGAGYGHSLWTALPVRRIWWHPAEVRAASALSDQRAELRDVRAALVTGSLVMGPMTALLQSGSDGPSSLLGSLLASPILTFGALLMVGDVQADLLLGGRFVLLSGRRRIGYRRFLEEARQAGVLLDSGIAYRFADADLQHYLADQVAQADQAGSDSLPADPLQTDPLQADSSSSPSASRRAVA